MSQGLCPSCGAAANLSAANYAGESEPSAEVEIFAPQ